MQYEVLNNAINSEMSLQSIILPQRGVLLIEIEGSRPAISTIEAFANKDGFSAQIVKMPLEMTNQLVLTKPDVLILSVDFLDAITLDQLSKIHNLHPLPIVVFADQNVPEVLELVVSIGVNSYVIDQIKPHRLPNIIDLAIERFKQAQNLKQELNSVKEKLSERKLIEKAKGILMQQKNLSEDQAYKQMRRSAMDQGKPMVELSKQVISVFEMLD